MSGDPRASDPSDSARLAAARADTLGFPQASADTGDHAAAASPTPGSADDPGGSGKRRSLIGQTLGDLELIEELGRGGMGIVFKARQKSLDRIVAVKLLLAEHYVDPVRLARFYAEARAAACLDHQNIVQVYQVGECEVGHFLVMEYVDGQPLEAIIAKKKIPIESAIAVTAVIAEAVHFAHSKGIVHRDLKPGNIMVDRSRRPVVMDFGIAKFVGKSSSLTQQGVVMGTPAFMAPEQAGESTEEVGPHSDVYSLGAILYMMLTGRPPYDGETALGTILKVIGPDGPPSIRSLQPHVPEELEDICMKCLSKKPAHRYPSAKELADDLRQFRATGRVSKGAATLTKRRASQTIETTLPHVYLVPRGTKRPIRVSAAQAIVGRTSECDIIVRAGDVSKQHCLIKVEEDGVFVEDLGSANGTFVNDQQIDRAQLRHKDVLRVADHEFVVRFAKPKSSE